MAPQSHSDDGEQVENELTDIQRRAAREAARLEPKIYSAEGDHMVQQVNHADGRATLWVVNEGLDWFSIDMMRNNRYELVDFNSELATAAFRRKYQSTH